MAKRSRLRFEADDQLGGFLSQTDTEFDKPSNDISDGDDIERFNERVKLFDSKLSNSAKASKNEAQKDFIVTGGVFQEIELFNFMCHEHLKVELKENINFVTGNNGSGKSAIITGLTVCLGARASTTQRGTKFETLIREGSAEARISVKITNCGPLRFKGDLYGDSIIVERRFRRNGLNSFKTKAGASGRIISDRKDEVVSICDNFNIQVNNPLSILTQETAKKFLVNSLPRDLYDFFMRATQLEQLSVDFRYALDRMNSIRNSLEAAKSSWPSFKEIIEALRIELQTINEKKFILQKMNELKAEVLWAQVAMKESEAQEKEYQISAEQARINSNNENANVLSRKLQDIIGILKTIDTEITSLYKSKAPLNDELKRAEHDIQIVIANLKETELVSKSINKDMTRMKVELKHIEDKLTECMNNNDSEKGAKMNEIENLQFIIQQKNREFNELENQKLIKSEECEELESRNDTITMSINDAAQQVNFLTRDFEIVRSSVSDRITQFGENLPEAIEQIKQNSKQFKHKPIGPIGMHVELLDLQWSRSLDAIIGSHLRSFITHDHDDRILLESILRSCKCQNPVINLSRHPIDTRNGEPDKNLFTALRALKIDNESVKKALVMFSNIEKIVLIEDRIEARKVMGARLKNVDTVYTKTHRITSTQNSLAFFAIYPNSKGNPFESGEERLRVISKQLEIKTHSLNVMKRDAQETKEGLQTALVALENIKDKIKAVKQAISLSKSEIKVIEELLSSADESGINVLNSEKEEIENRISSLKSQFMDNFESQLAFKEKLDGLEEKISSIKDSLKNIEIQLDDKQAFIGKLSTDKRQIISEIDFYQNSNSQHSKNVSVYAQALEIILGEINVLKNKASAICERLNTKRSITSIEKEIHNLEKQIEMGQDFNERNFDEIKLEYEMKSAEYENSKANVRINENILDDMKIALENRQLKWENLRGEIAKRSNQDFAACLQARGYRGHLEYDHKNKELHINVCIDQIEQNSSKKFKGQKENQDLPKRDIKQLSGGEKSFGTTCFLLSLWDAMECPIRCLDEFDVFMDAVNRRLVVEMLINNARKSGTQFILITPVSVRAYLNVEDQDNVHIVVLNDPRKIA